MNDHNENKHALLRHTASRENTTRIWRAQGEPLGSSVSAGDRRFVRRALVFSGIALIILVAMGWIAVQNAAAVKASYASLLIAQNRFSQAERVIDSIDDGSIKEQLLKKLYFSVAESYVSGGKTAEAIPLYQAAGDYPGAEDQLRKAGYALAQFYEADGDFQEASLTYDALGDYLDAVEKSKACNYAYAMERLEYGYYEESMRLFYALGSYEDSEAYAKEAAAQLSQNEGAGDLVSLLVGLNEEQLTQRARLKSEREALPAGMIATGYKHTVARTEYGTVLATGSNLSGQCNTNEWTGIVAVAAGAYHTVGLRADGTVVATGMNTYGQCNVSKWTNVTAIFAGA